MVTAPIFNPNLSLNPLPNLSRTLNLSLLLFLFRFRCFELLALCIRRPDNAQVRLGLPGISPKWKPYETSYLSILTVRRLVGFIGRTRKLG